MKLDDKYSLTSLANLNHFRRSWMYNTITIDEIIDKINNFGGFELINNGQIRKPSLNWMKGVGSSRLKEYHSAKLSSMPPIKSADFLYKKK